MLSNLTSILSSNGHALGHLEGRQQAADRQAGRQAGTVGSTVIVFLRYIAVRKHIFETGEEVPHYILMEEFEALKLIL